MMSDRPKTEADIRKLATPEKDTLVALGASLYLNLRRSGRKTFLVRRRVGGQWQVKTVGDFPAVTLQSARAAAAQPTTVEERRTFAEVAAIFRDDVLILRYKDPTEAIAALVRDMPNLQKVRLDRLTRRDWTAEIVRKAKTSPGAVQRTLAVNKQFSKWMAVRGFTEHDILGPVTANSLGLKGYTPREIVLTDPEIRHVLTSEGGHWAVLQFALRTGCRIREALGIHDDRIEDGVWHLPASRSKNAKSHKLPLPPKALELLGEPWRSDKYATVHAWMRGMVPQLRWTAHDLRRTAATRMAAAGVDRQIVEDALNHKPRGILAVYQQDDRTPGVGRALLVLESELRKIIEAGGEDGTC